MVRWTGLAQIERDRKRGRKRGSERVGGRKRECGRGSKRVGERKREGAERMPPPRAAAPPAEMQNGSSSFQGQSPQLERLHRTGGMATARLYTERERAISKIERSRARQSEIEREGVERMPRGAWTSGPGPRELERQRGNKRKTEREYEREKALLEPLPLLPRCKMAQALLKAKVHNLSNFTGRVVWPPHGCIQSEKEESAR